MKVKMTSERVGKDDLKKKKNRKEYLMRIGSMFLFFSSCQPFFGSARYLE